MLRSAKGRWVRNVLALIGAIAAGGWLIQRFQEWTGRDPFASYRNTAAAESIGIRLNDVSIRHYEANKLVLEAQVERVDVQRDRQVLDLFNVGNGVYHVDDDLLNFSAESARYDQALRRLSVSSGARVSGKDFDIVTPAFLYTEGSGVLTAPGEFKGRLFEGEVKGENLVLTVPDRTFEFGPVSWQGMAKVPGADLQDEPKRTKWAVSGDKVKRTGDRDIFTNASATDGEIMVKAPTIERDIKTDVITATGKVYYFSAKANVLCEKAVIHRKEKRAVLSGNVTMLLKPKDKEVLDFQEIEPFRPDVPEEVSNQRPTAPSSPEGDQQKDLDDEVRSVETRRKYPVVVRADQIDYHYSEGKRRAIITGSPQARQMMAGGRWRQIWTFEGYYDGEKERLRLTSPPGKREVRMKTSLGDDIVADWVELSTKEGDEEYEAENVKGDLYPDEEDTAEIKGGGTSGGGG